MNTHSAAISVQSLPLLFARMEADTDFAKELAKHAAASGALSHGDIDVIRLLVMVWQQYMRTQLRKAVSSAGGAPLLTSYSADGTPALVKHHVKHKSPAGSSVLRVGKSSHEFLVQLLF